MKSSDLSALERVFDLKFETAQNKLMQHRKQIADVKAKLQELTDARTRYLQKERTEADAATIAGADVQWQRWIDQRRKDLNIDLARLLAEEDGLAKTLKKAFGKQVAMKGVIAAEIERAKPRPRSY